MTLIKVQNIQTGQTGTMEDWDYNPQQFKKLEASASSGSQNKQNNSLLSTLLPIALSIGGGILGAPLGPAGIIAGGAGGGALGGALTGGDILKEGAMGAAGGLFPAFRAGKAARTLSAGAKVAENVGSQTVGKVAQRPGTNLAAKTLASNFTVPSKLGREGLNIEDGISKALQDKIPIQNSIGGWSKLANEITGESGAISKGMRTAANSAKTPINYDQALTDAAAFSKQFGEIEKDTLPIIRGFFTGRKPVAPGFISATDAHDVAGQLEKEGYQLIKAYGEKALTPNLSKANKGHILVGVAEDLRNQIAQAANDEGLLPVIQQQIVQVLGEKYPTIAEKVMQAQSLPEIRSIAAPYVNISKAADFTKAYQQAPFNRGGDQLALRLAGAGAGFGVGNIPGALAGAAFGPAVAGAAQAAQPVLTGVAARGILGAGKVAGQLPMPRNLGSNILGQAGSRALMGGIPEAEAAGPMPEMPADPNQSQQPDLTDFLKMAALSDLSSGGKHINEIIALSNFLNPPTGAATKSQLQQIEGAQGLLDQLENRFGQAVQTGEFGGLGRGPLSTATGRISGGRIARNALLYDNTREGFTALIARSTGERGVLTDADAERAKKLLPTNDMDPETAAQQFEEIRQIFYDAQSRIGGTSQWNIPMPENYSL